MDEKDLRSIIEQVLTEMNVSGAKPAEKAAAACACESAPEVEDGCILGGGEVACETTNSISPCRSPMR